MERHWINRMIAVILGLAVFIVMFIGAFRFMLFNEKFFLWHYTAHDVVEETGINIYDLTAITSNMLDYLKGERETLDMTILVDGQLQEVFNKREKAHMVDVKDLYMNVVRFQLICALVGFVALGLGLWRRILPYMLKGLKWTFLFAGSIVAVAAALFAANFYRWFILFHKLFFSNDLWILDPRTDLLINLVPEIYFYQIVAFSSSIFLASILIMAIAGHKTGKWLERKV